MPEKTVNKNSRQCNEDGSGITALSYRAKADSFPGNRTEQFLKYQK